MDIRVSVIIPVYNVEKYLKKCLNSVINQTLREIEIICVNDGSTDNSLKILEEYVEKDERIKIINKENEGLGAARKTGLRYANGSYISFVDSDDWIELDSYEKLYENAVSNKSDVVMFDLNRYDENKKEYSYVDGCNVAQCFNDKNIDYNNFNFDYTSIKIFLLNKSFSACTKLYKSQFLRGYDDFYFPKHIAYEDVPFHVQVLLRAKRISFCPLKLYIYRISNVDSMINASAKSRKIFDIFIIVNKVEEILKENKVFNNFKYDFYSFKVSQLYHWIDKCGDDFRNEYFELVKEEFENIGLSADGINELYLNAKNKYEKIVTSKSCKEFEQFEKRRVLKSDNNIDESEKLKYYQDKLNCLQKKQIRNISKIQALEKDSKYLKEQLKILKNDSNNIKKELNIIANTKPYRIAYALRRFSHEFLKGNINHKKDFIKWIFFKLIKKDSGLEFKYNPLIALTKKKF